MAEQNQNNKQAQEPDLNQIRKNKREKLANLQAAGKDPFQITNMIRHIILLMQRKVISSSKASFLPARMILNMRQKER